jgi:hypothetical protein
MITPAACTREYCFLTPLNIELVIQDNLFRAKPKRRNISSPNLKCFKSELKIKKISLYRISGFHGCSMPVWILFVGDGTVQTNIWR